VVFAQAENTDKLVAWAVLNDIQITPNGTDYTFSNLTKLRKPLRRFHPRRAGRRSCDRGPRAPTRVAARGTARVRREYFQNNLR